MSLRIAPPAAHASSTKPVASAPSAPGLPDTLRNNTTSNVQTSNLAANTQPHLHPSEPASNHPLEARLAQWRATQHALKMSGLRRTFGIAEPVRRGMELGIAREGEWRPLALGGSEGVSGDVLEGRDWSIEWEDVYDGGRRDGLALAGREEGGMLAEVEGKVKMNAL